jgi:hypothetical protein
MSSVLDLFPGILTVFSRRFWRFATLIFESSTPRSFAELHDHPSVQPEVILDPQVTVPPSPIHLFSLLFTATLLTWLRKVHLLLSFFTGSLASSSFDFIRYFLDPLVYIKLIDKMSWSFADHNLSGASSDSEDSFDKSVLPLLSRPFPFLTRTWGIFSGRSDLTVLLHGKNPMDISVIPDDLAAYPDDRMDQSSILGGIVGTSRYNESSEEVFNRTPMTRLKLSKLRTMFENNDPKAVDLLSTRHSIHIDDKLQVRLGTGDVMMTTKESMIDYYLTVGNCVGFSPLLPNVPSAHQFCFEMDLKKPYSCFKGKHAMLGFDPAGCMWYVGRCNNEDVFLAMAPKEFLRGHMEPAPPGHSSASPAMSKRHYRQVLMMIVHFLALIPQRSFQNRRKVYEQNLDTQRADFDKITDAM